MNSKRLRMCRHLCFSTNVKENIRLMAGLYGERINTHIHDEGNLTSHWEMNAEYVKQNPEVKKRILVFFKSTMKHDMFKNIYTIKEEKFDAFEPIFLYEIEKYMEEKVIVEDTENHIITAPLTLTDDELKELGIVSSEHKKLPCDITCGEMINHFRMCLNCLFTKWYLINLDEELLKAMYAYKDSPPIKTPDNSDGDGGGINQTVSGEVVEDDNTGVIHDEVHDVVHDVVHDEEIDVVQEEVVEIEEEKTDCSDEEEYEEEATSEEDFVCVSDEYSSTDEDTDDEAEMIDMEYEEIEIDID